MELNEIQKVLVKEFNCSWQRATDDIPIDRILVNLIGAEVDFFLEIAYVPDADNQLETMKLLQLITVLPCQPKTKQSQAEVEQLILHLNRIVPLMGFGYDSDNNSVFFRHVAMMAKERDTYNGEIVKEIVWLILYILEMFYQTINAIVLGRKTIAELKQSFYS